MRLRLLTVALCLVALPLGASASNAAPTSAPCADIAQFPELAGSLCLTQSLPLRHEAPDLDTIDVAVRRFPAADPARRRGEIWLVAGGPGEPGAALLPFLPTFRRAFSQYDLVIPDHRGTGGSTRLCPTEESADSADGYALAPNEWGPCIGAMYADPARTAAFSTTQAAQDLSALIARYHGDGEVLVYGVSYGTQLVLRMLQITPAPVDGRPLDGMILDGLVPPESAPQWDLGHRTAVVDTVGRAVLGEAGSARYAHLLATADPTLWQAVVPGGDLRGFLGRLLNFPELRARIPAIIDGLSAGDTAPLQAAVAELQTTLAPLTRHPQSPPSLPLVMLISASENNGRRDLSRADVEAEARDALFTSAIPGFLVEAPVPLYPRDAWFGHTPATLPRTLVIHGTLDPNTPYAGAQAHAALLADAGPLRFVTVEGGAHLLPLVAPDCFVAAANAFVRDQPVPASCTP